MVQAGNSKCHYSFTMPSLHANDAKFELNATRIREFFRSDRLRRRLFFISDTSDLTDWKISAECNNQVLHPWIEPFYHKNERRTD